ncbi:hypothetical protein C6503_12345 [Candidatus Poribacteria bacterium]|nr:MAG: hypothetical protein C6503_12345 [Candidatus Poribacteria bacterium]
MKTYKKGGIVLLILFFCGNIVNVFANGIHAASEKESTEQIASARPDNYAPLGVMGDPVHSAGEMMFSYRSIEMAMDGLQDGNAISIEETLENYLMVPTRMRMRVHMFGAMFAPHDRITLMAMMSYRTNFIQMKGAHLHSPGGDGPVGHHHIIGDPSGTIAGFGDITLAALIPLINAANTDLRLNAGASIPTGSIISARGAYTSSTGVTGLHYPMQMGSGSFELRPGLTFAATHGAWSYGAQARGAIRLNKNKRDYRLAPTIGSTLWSARRLNDSLSIYLRGSFENWGNVTAFTSEKERASHDRYAALIGTTRSDYASPTMDPNLQRGRRGSVSAGVNFIFPDTPGGILAGQRFTFEFQMPVYQNLDGPQMALDSTTLPDWRNFMLLHYIDWTIVAGWQYPLDQNSDGAQMKLDWTIVVGSRNFLYLTDVYISEFDWIIVAGWQYAFGLR